MILERRPTSTTLLLRDDTPLADSRRRRRQTAAMCHPLGAPQPPEAAGRKRARGGAPLASRCSCPPQSRSSTTGAGAPVKRWLPRRLPAVAGLLLCRREARRLLQRRHPPAAPEDTWALPQVAVVMCNKWPWSTGVPSLRSCLHPLQLRPKRDTTSLIPQWLLLPPLLQAQHCEPSTKQARSRKKRRRERSADVRMTILTSAASRAQPLCKLAHVRKVAGVNMLTAWRSSERQS
mmetsp:Transcript_28193/g.65482  ORF Transcript_28193/g.65482 Transcript_28193/m.65482 type:complete len:234 (+) Transcript_28193:111-812(+)